MNTPDQVYTLLRDALLKARADGLRIVFVTFGDGKRTCCALTAYTRNSVAEMDVDAIADRLKISNDEAWQIIDGFDDNDNPRNDFYAVGQKLRDEFIEQKGEA